MNAKLAPVFGLLLLAPLPFEMRRRTVLWDQLFTRIEAEDPHMVRPVPSAG